ncbi:MAG: IPT/TIG domain-containing protein, partial [Verrucomicrobiota bacterium]
MNGSLGVALSPQPVVQVMDSDNNVVTSYQGPIGLAIQYNPGGGILTYTPKNAVNGVATFTDATITVGGGIGYTLTASLPPLSAISAAFDIPNPAPTLTSLNPAGVVTGGGPASVVVSGSSFVPASVVLVNGSPVATAFSSASILTALISTATSGNYPVTVSNPPAAGGVSSPLDFTVGPTPTIVYVDGSYGPGNSGTHSWGYDAFATIANGIAAVSSGGTVNVAAGTYAGNVVVNKAVTLSGAQHGVDACGRSASESIIESANGGVAVGINVGGVVLNGFKIKNGIVTATGTGISIVNNILSLDVGVLDAGSLGATPSGIRLGAVSGAITVSQNRVDVTGAAVVGGYTQAPLWGQLGWTGGAQPDFQNDDTGIDNGDGTFGDEKVTSAAAHTGSNAWRYSRGYGSPGQGTPYTPGLSAAVDADGKSLQATVWFKAVNPAGDNSNVAIETGTPDGTDRGNYLAFLTATPSGVEIVSFNNGTNFDQVNLFTGV